MKLAIVEWIDSMSGNTWEDLDASAKFVIPVIKTVGWVINSNKQALSLAATILPSQRKQTGQTFTIPKGCIKKITYVGSKYTIKA